MENLKKLVSTVRDSLADGKITAFEALNIAIKVLKAKTEIGQLIQALRRGNTPEVIAAVGDERDKYVLLLQDLSGLITYAHRVVDRLKSLDKPQVKKVVNNSEDIADAEQPPQ